MAKDSSTIQDRTRSANVVIRKRDGGMIGSRRAPQRGATHQHRGV